ncbi:flagellar protein [Desulfuromonas versatilis]|uniref:Flagellar protein n=1 Tax=Desulfuromonas versatilis TaxID=2802975 RepID=A0ABM8I0K2_9BACT|nr:TIGR02530 family flagellar biosynthesis protein [Desulfuromonas versatilis]BCR06630.1 flagellar protein [Desulfuromonas versatilis]
MTDKFNIFPQPIAPAGQSAGARPKGQPGAAAGPSFEEVLQGQVQAPGKLQFSRHALSRMESRGIQFGPEALSRLESAVSQVNAKGGRDSLVLLDQTALVVSVKNSTVVTVVDQQSLKGNVFTNIDSAVIA